ncbi:MAG: alpha/beta hydrolase, partial [Solobacterium sp.]|nr:alpha/beta hydrolase [Solobacterium sp.]
LMSLGIEGPYILVPHSASGLEAVYWAGKYPDEVEAIIGLDPAVPKQYDCMPGTHITEMEPQDAEEAVEAMKMNDLLQYRIGLIRLTMDPDSLLAALRSDALAEEEKEQYRALFYTKFCEGSGSTMMRETICTEHSLQVLLELYNSPAPDVPSLFFVSSDEAMLARPYGSLSAWYKIHEDYLAHVTDGKIVYMDCGHYIHAEEPETVSAEMTAFIESLPRRKE